MADKRMLSASEIEHVAKRGLDDGYVNQFHVQRLLDHIAAVTEERDEAETQCDAFDAKIKSLAPHGTCACSYDKPEDICLHHTPKMNALQSEVSALTEERDKAQLNAVNAENAAKLNYALLKESQSEVAALRKDKERIDWLESLAVIEREWSTDLRCWHHDRYSVARWTITSVDRAMLTAREAIDAAMQKCSECGHAASLHVGLCTVDPCDCRRSLAIENGPSAPTPEPGQCARCGRWVQSSAGAAMPSSPTEKKVDA